MTVVVAVLQHAPPTEFFAATGGWALVRAAVIRQYSGKAQRWHHMHA